MKRQRRVLELQSVYFIPHHVWWFCLTAWPTIKREKESVQHVTLDFQEVLAYFEFVQED